MVAVVTGSGLGLQNASGVRIGPEAVLGDENVGWLGSKVSVNAKNGNLVIQNMDEILTGKGPDSIFSRVDNSEVYTTGGEWREGSQRAVNGLTGTVNTAGSTITRTDWDGSAMVYTWNATASAYTRPGVGDKLTFASNVWTWTDQARQVTETFDSLNGGRITSRKDTDLNALTYTYNGSGKLTRVASQSGDYTDLSYDGNGNLSQLITRKSDGTLLDSRVSYTYDPSNRLQTCTIDLTPTNTSDSSTVTYTYTYDGTSTRVASISESGTGNVISFTYTSMDKYRVTQVQETGPNGVRTTNISYDTTNKITSVTDPLGKVTQLTYDSNGCLTQIKYPPATTGAAQQIFQYGYNTTTQDLTSATDALGHVTAYTYDSNHNMTQSRDAAGNTIDYIYDINNQLLNEIHYLTADPDGSGTGVASNPVVIRRVYDGERHLRYLVDGDGHVTEYQYNAPGQLVSTIKYTTAAFNVSLMSKTATLSETSDMNPWVAGLSASDKSSVQRADATYDYRGNLYTVTQYSATDSSENGLTTSPYTTTTYVYDQYGFLLSKQVSGISGSQVYGYDGLGRLISSTDFAGNQTTINIVDGTRTTTVTLANGLVKTSVYSAQGELVSYAESGSDISTETETYKYDALGRLRVTSDALAQKDFVFYDDAGRKVGYLDRRGYLTEYKYDAENRLVATVTYATKLTSTAVNTLYDANGYPTTATIASVRPASDAADVWTWNIYDYANRLIETIDGQGSATVFAYDGDDRLVQTSRYFNAIAASTVAGYKTTAPSGLVTPTADAAHDQVTRYFYDNSGRKIGTLDGVGSYTETKYDQAGRAIQTIAHANFATYSSGSVSVTASSADRVSYFVYDGRGDIRYTLDANLRSTEYVYDSANNVIRTIDYGAPIGSSSSYSLTYVQGQISTLNLVNNVDTRITRYVYDTAGRKAFEINAGDSRGSYVTAYGYNNAGQVIKETRYYTPFTVAGDQTLSFMQSWATGNVNGKDRVTRQLFDMLGRLAYEVDAEGYVTRHLYDLDDRLVEDIRYASVPSPAVTDSTTKAGLDTQLGSTIPSDAVTHTYNYDQNGNLTDAYDGENVQTHYSYDAFGRAYSIIEAYGTSDAAETRIVFDTANRIQSKTTAYGVAEAATTYYGYDALGNITSITDPNNGLTTRSYDAAGNMLTETVQLDASTNAVTSRAYNAFGQLWRLTDPRLNPGYFYYDKLGRLELQIDAEGYATATTYTIGDQPASTTRYYQRATNLGQMNTRPTLTTDPKDATTTISYDKLDRVIGTTDAEQYKNINGVVELAHEDYTLNAFGDREFVRNRWGGVTQNDFYKNGLLKQETLPVGSTDKNGNVISTAIVNTFQYDARGNRTQMIEALGLPEQRTTNYVYDKNNRLKSKTGDNLSVLNPATMATSTVVAPGENYTYDLRGNLILSVDATGAKTYNYYDDNDRKTASISAVGTLSTWTYDLNGNMMSAKVYATAVALPASAGGTLPAGYASGVYRETIYSYDKNNRLSTSTVRGLFLNGSVQNAPIIGSYNGANWVTSSAGITTQNLYDAAGNLIQQIDANGNSLFTYYDKNGHKTAQVDQSKYLTTWLLDTEGNVLTETRYANAVTGTVTSASVPSVVADSVNDRISTFTYDRAGRRLTETRKNVQVGTVTSNNIATASVDATITYTYNGLGEVLTKAEATGDTTTYGYDAAGRQTSVTGQSFTDFNNATVQQQLVTSYDGLNNVSRTVQNGTRATTYSYGAGGRLTTMTDPTGFATSYYYDADGRLTATTYSRLKSDGTSVSEAKSTSYDLAGRITAQRSFSWNGTVWVSSGDTSEMFYNVYGDMIARGVNSGGVLANAQEYAEYDAAGRMWRTNFNDGVGKAYFYDANGNATLLLQTLGSTDLKSGFTDPSITVNQNAIIAAVGSGVTATISVYDGRNKLTDTIQTTTSNSGANPVHAVLASPINNAGAQYFNSAINVASSNISATGLNATNLSGPTPFTTPSGTVSFTYINFWSEITGTVRSLSISVPDAISNGGTFHVYNGAQELTYSQTSSSGNTLLVPDIYTVSMPCSITVTQNIPGQPSQVFVASQTITGEDIVTYAVTAKIKFYNENASTTALRMLVRPQGSSGPYTQVTASQLYNYSGSAISGWFSYDLSQPPFSNQASTSWDIKYVAADATGNLYDAKQGTLTIDGSGNPSVSFAAMPVNGPGQAIATWDTTYYTLLFTGFPIATQHVSVFYRAVGSGAAFTSLPVNTVARGGAYGQNGWWTGRPPTSGGPYEFWVEAFDGNGALISKSKGTFMGGGQPSSESGQAYQLTQYSDLPETVVLTPPSGATITSQRMFINGSWVSGPASGVWNYDANWLVPDRLASYSYAIQYETYNGSTLVSHADGTLNLGYNGQSVAGWNNTQPVTAKVKFAPQQGNSVSRIRLYWRDQGSTGPFQPVDVTISGGVGYWDVDAAGVRPNSGTRNLEYYYDAYDASNNLMPTMSGTDHVQGKIAIQSDQYTNTSDTEMYWVIDAGSHPSFTIHRLQSFNAFGEIASETSGRYNPGSTDPYYNSKSNWTTNFTYNTEGKLIRKSNPLVDVTDENGVTSTNVATSEYYYYDKSGRQIGKRDATAAEANGNLTIRTLLVGSGYGGSDATVLAENRINPGNLSVVTSMQYAVDVFGDVRKVTDGLGKVTLNFYDAADRLIEVDHAMRVGGNSNGTQAKDYYAYDGLGQRIKHWNAQLGSGVVETTDYDIEGRVISTKSFAGQATNYKYTYYNGSIIGTWGLGNFGGWRIDVTSNGETNLSDEVHYHNIDIFGRQVWNCDMSGRYTAYQYDLAGHLIHQVQTTSNYLVPVAGGQNIDFTYYANGYVASVTDNALKMKSTFEYDNDGNRTLETYNSTDANPKFYQNAAITYDAENRVTRFLDAKADITYKYDAVGNRRNVHSVYTDGLGNSAIPPQDYWYKYDAANRFTLTMGQLSGGAIVLGATNANNNAVLISYDAAGNRATATYGRDGTTESYSYTADGYLENVTIAGMVRSKRTNDAMGRVTGYVEYAADGVTQTKNRSDTYDNDNRITDETLAQGSTTTTTHNDYKAWNGTSYNGVDQGVITHSSSVQNSVTTNTNYFYSWWDEAKQDTIKINASDPTNRNSGSWKQGVSVFAYDVNGHITKLTDYGSDGAVGTTDDRVVTYENDAYGQVLVSETKVGSALGPRQLYYYFNGHRIGDVGNNGQSPTQFDYAQVLAFSGAKLSDPKSSFRYGKPVASADFDENYQPINDQYPGQAASIYTVNAGDTLQSIAQSAWGDSAMWYLIADANGLNGSESLQAGQRLIIPNKVANFHNNSTTFKVYDPGEAIGDTLPTLPPEPAPPHHKGCGIIGQILMIAVAIAVTVIALPAGAPTILEGVLAGAAGAAASQTFGVLTGIQDKFSFKAVALGAIAGGVSAGLGGIGFLDGAKGFTGVVQDAARGAIGNAITQGVSVATGLQDRFDWTGVAVGGVVGGVVGFASDHLAQLNLGSATASKIGTQFLSGMAGAIAGGAARSLIDGSDFGDNVIAALPDVIGSTIGSTIGNALVARGDPADADLVKFSARELAEMAPGQVRTIDVPPSAPQSDIVYLRNANFWINASKNNASSLVSTLYDPEILKSLPSRIDLVYYRSVIYSTLDSALNSPGSAYNSSFFAAASDVTGITALTGAQLSSTLTNAFGVESFYDPVTLDNVRRLGGDLYQYVNVPLFRALYHGDDNFKFMNGQTLGSVAQGGTLKLDYAIVHNEQTYVQSFLNKLPAGQRAAFISQSNDALSLSGGVVQQTMKNLDHPFNFGNQADREAIGRALVRSNQSLFRRTGT